MNVSLDEIRESRERIKGRILHTPMPRSLHLSNLLGCEVYCKLDNTQATGSFKERGACNRLMLLEQEKRRRGVICASAGNHAQAVAFHGRALEIPVTVVMPKFAPLVKVSRCRSFGANVILHGESFGEARAEALRLCEERKLFYVQGFDDPAIIAGAGTMGLEILEDLPDVDAVFVGVGGGGLLAGLMQAILPSRPGVKFYPVESATATSLHDSLENHKVTAVQTRPTLADGLGVNEIGKLCFDIVKDRIEPVVLVNETQIAQAILRLMEMEKTVAEGAGAAPLAAAVLKKEELKGKKIVLAICGGNIDVNTIGRVIERGLRLDGRLCKVAAQISDRPGGLAHLLNIVAAAGASILQIYHDRAFGPADVAQVSVSCVVETQGMDHVDKLKAALKDAGIDATIQT